MQRTLAVWFGRRDGGGFHIYESEPETDTKARGHDLSVSLCVFVIDRLEFRSETS